VCLIYSVKEMLLCIVICLRYRVMEMLLCSVIFFKVTVWGKYYCVQRCVFEVQGEENVSVHSDVILRYRGREILLCILMCL